FDVPELSHGVPVGAKTHQGKKAALEIAGFAAAAERLRERPERSARAGLRQRAGRRKHGQNRNRRPGKFLPQVRHAQTSPNQLREACGDFVAAAMRRYLPSLTRTLVAIGAVSPTSST